MTIDGVDVSKTGSQDGTGIKMLYSSGGTNIIRNCKVQNRKRGIEVSDAPNIVSNYVIEDNDLTLTGFKPR